MKLIEQNLLPPKDQLIEERQAKLESKFVGSLRPKAGHKCYKYNWKTGKLYELTDEDYFDAVVEIVKPFKLYNKPDGMTIGNLKKNKPKEKKEPLMKSTRKIKVEPDTHYFTCLNNTNAVKYVKKNFYPQIKITKSK